MGKNKLCIKTTESHGLFFWNGTGEQFKNRQRLKYFNRPPDCPKRIIFGITFGIGEQICLYESPTRHGYLFSQVYIISGSGF